SSEISCAQPWSPLLQAFKSTFQPLARRVALSQTFPLLAGASFPHTLKLFTIVRSVFECISKSFGISRRHDAPYRRPLEVSQSEAKRCNNRFRVPLFARSLEMIRADSMQAIRNRVLPVYDALTT